MRETRSPVAPLQPGRANELVTSITISILTVSLIFASPSSEPKTSESKRKTRNRDHLSQEGHLPPKPPLGIPEPKCKATQSDFSSYHLPQKKDRQKGNAPSSQHPSIRLRGRRHNCPKSKAVISLRSKAPGDSKERKTHPNQELVHPCGRGTASWRSRGLRRRCRSGRGRGAFGLKGSARGREDLSGWKWGSSQIFWASESKRRGGLTLPGSLEDLGRDRKGVRREEPDFFAHKVSKQIQGEEGTEGILLTRDRPINAPPPHDRIRERVAEQHDVPSHLLLVPHVHVPYDDGINLSVQVRVVRDPLRDGFELPCQLGGLRGADDDLERGGRGEDGDEGAVASGLGGGGGGGEERGRGWSGGE